MNEERTPTSISNCLFHTDDEETQAELEEFRISYERRHGQTDLTRRYTSTWPENERLWLAKMHPAEYFNGLPPFVKAFLKQKMENSLQQGTGDNLPNSMIKLYMSGKMELDHEDRGFER